MAMKLAAKVQWTNAERTRGKVILLWRCSEHQLQTRAGDLGQAPPPCPRCAGYHYQVVKRKVPA